MMQTRQLLQSIAIGVAALAPGCRPARSPVAQLAQTRESKPAPPDPVVADPTRNISYMTPRMSVRALVYELRGGVVPTIPGQFMIHHTQPEWHKEYEPEFDTRTRGIRWRFCIDFWTVLDTNVPLSIGGKRFVPGDYYLLIARSLEGQWSLVVLDAASVRAQKLDATQAEETTEGTLVPLKYEKLESVEPKLRIDLTADPERPRRFVLDIRYGPHKASLEIHAEV